MTPNELVLTFGGLHVCVQFGENRRRNATVRVSTDGHTHARTDAKRFYYLSHAICYSYGADNNNTSVSVTGGVIMTTTTVRVHSAHLMSADPQIKPTELYSQCVRI